MIVKYLLLGTGLVLIFVACADRGAVPGVPVPSARMAAESGTSIDTLGEGYSLFHVHCAQCHELKMPKDMGVKDWHTIVPGMAWNAGLKKADETAILAYLVAATEEKNKAALDKKL